MERTGGKEMTIREVLNADCDVDRINVTIREEETTKYIMRYCIGRDVEAGISERFLYETEYGGVYGEPDIKTLYIRRTIQHCQLKDLSNSKIGLRGVLEKEIPKELLGLTVGRMSPYRTGHSDEIHGYYFTCYVDTWSGLPGENSQIHINELNQEKKNEER